MIPIIKLPYDLPINTELTTEVGETFNACLHVDKKPISRESDGVNPTRINLSGRLVNNLLPVGVGVDSRLRCVWENVDNNQKINGVFIVKDVFQSQWETVNLYYGATISGEFIPENDTNQGGEENPFLG